MRVFRPSRKLRTVTFFKVFRENYRFTFFRRVNFCNRGGIFAKPFFFGNYGFRFNRVDFNGNDFLRFNRIVFRQVCNITDTNIASNVRRQQIRTCIACFFFKNNPFRRCIRKHNQQAVFFLAFHDNLRDFNRFPNVANKVGYVRCKRNRRRNFFYHRRRTIFAISRRRAFFICNRRGIFFAFYHRGAIFYVRRYAFRAYRAGIHTTVFLLGATELIKARSHPRYSRNAQRSQ